MSRCIIKIDKNEKREYLKQKRFSKRLGPGVLTKCNKEKGGQLIDSVPMSTRRQPSNLCLLLRLLGCHIVEIGMKLHSVKFAVKFFSPSDVPRLYRTWLQYALCEISSQVGPSPTIWPKSNPKSALSGYARLSRLEIGLRLTWLDLVRLETELVSRPPFSVELFKEDHQWKCHYIKFLILHWKFQILEKSSSVCLS